MVELPLDSHTGLVQTRRADAARYLPEPLRLAIPKQSAGQGNSGEETGIEDQVRLLRDAVVTQTVERNRDGDAVVECPEAGAQNRLRGPVCLSDKEEWRRCKASDRPPW